MKKCKECGVDFKPKTSNTTICSDKCRKARHNCVTKKWSKDNICKMKAYSSGIRDDWFSVYYLPEEHYVGMTDFLSYRIKQHDTGRVRNYSKVAKQERSKITEGFEVLARFKSEVDAHWFEVSLHRMGYIGSRYKRIKD
jgi:hypothetical protein